MRESIDATELISRLSEAAICTTTQCFQTYEDAGLGTAPANTGPATSSLLFVATCAAFFAVAVASHKSVAKAL